MHKRSIIFIAATSALLLTVLPAGRLSSCGPSLEADETRLALFRSDLDGRSGLRPFYFSENLFNISEPDPEKLDQQENCREWVDYSKNNATKKDVFSIQYETSPALFLDAYKKDRWEKFEGNTFISWLQKKENRGSLDYMALAKRAENIFTLPADPWDTVTIARDQIAFLIRDAKNSVASSSNLFLQQRYAFQAIKLMHYSEEDDRSDLIQTYDLYLKNKPSIVARWGLIYYALSQQNPQLRTLNLLKAFDASEEKKRVAFQQLSKNNLAVLKKNTTDKSTLALIYAMETFMNPGKSLESIEALYHTDPKSKYLPVLIGREVNKLENWIWSPAILGFPYNYINYYGSGEEKRPNASDLNYLDKFTNWLSTYRNETYNKLALVHLLSLQKKYVAAKDMLRQLPATMNNRFEIQRQIENMILLAHSKDLQSPIIKKEIALTAERLMALNPAYKESIQKEYIYPEEGSEQSDDLAELFRLLSISYKNAGDIVTASLLAGKVNISINEYSNGGDQLDNGYVKIGYLDRYAAPSDIDKLLAFKHAKHKTKFEQLITPAKWAKEDLYLDVKGTILLRQQKYREALVVFNSMDPKFWLNNYEYADYLPGTSITQTDLLPGEKEKLIKYPFTGKQFILKDIVSLLDNIKAATDDRTKAANYYRLGNALFNIGYDGKAWMMFSYGKSSGDESTDTDYNWAFYNFYPNNIKYGEDYYGSRNAINAYKKALSLSKDNELSAKCLLMLNYCDRYQVDHKTNATSKQTDWLKILSTNYRQTNNYKQAVMYCADVREYAGNTKK